MALFGNRREAGLALAERLSGLALTNPLVLGIPRGGVVVAAAIADALGWEIDVILVRKLRAPFQPELAIGAASEDGKVYVSPSGARVSGVSEAYLAREREHQMAEIARRRQALRGGRAARPVKDRTVVVTDDGIATGSTFFAALAMLRDQGAQDIVAAVPVAPPDRIPELRRRADRVVCLATPSDFYAVGQFYADFREVTDDDVRELLGHHVSTGAGLPA